MCQTCDMFEIRILKGVVSNDHIHILVSAPPEMAPMENMRRMKGRTSSELLEAFPSLKKRYWGRHFCATVGEISEEMSREYLEHHFEPDHRSVAVLRMRKGTSQSPFRLALGDNPGAPVRPAPGHGYVTTCPQGGGRTSPWPYVEWLDGVSDALASGLCGCGTSPLRHAGQTPAPTPTGNYRPSLRSPWPAAMELKLRLYFMQQWIGLAYEVLEDAVNDSQAFRGILAFIWGAKRYRMLRRCSSYSICRNRRA